MSAATSGSVGNFYEERAKVTHGRFNQARADWLLYPTFGNSDRSLFLPPGCDSGRLGSRFLCHRPGELPQGLRNRSVCQRRGGD